MAVPLQRGRLSRFGGVWEVDNLCNTYWMSSSPGQSTVEASDLRAFRFALDPTEDQKHDLARHFGTARWAFNHALARKVEAHNAWRAQVTALIDAGTDELSARRQVKVPIPGRQTIQRELNLVKGDDRQNQDGTCPWWHEVSTYAFQSAFADCDMAWKNWLSSLSGKRAGRKTGYPRFKKKGRARDSARIHHDVKKPTIRTAGYRHLVVPRIGSIRLHSSVKRMVRYLARTGGQVQSVTLSRSGRHYYAAVLVKAPELTAVSTHAQRENGMAGAVGVDLGVSRLATLSTGLSDSHDNPRHLANAKRKLARAQRKLSRTRKGSARRSKAIAQVAELHHRVAERRAGTLHRITKQLATGFATVSIEDLNVAGMTTSAKGTVEKPGKRVRQKAGLNRAILDVGFGEFRRQLDYKTRWYGSRLHVVDRWFPSSKTCSNCGSVKPKLDLSERTYRCDCGLVMDRDLNAAINIRDAAMSDALNVAGGKPETENARPSQQKTRSRDRAVDARRREGRDVSGHPVGVIPRSPPTHSDAGSLAGSG